MEPKYQVAFVFYTFVGLTGALLIIFFKKKSKGHISIGLGLSSLYWLWFGFLIIIGVAIQDKLNPFPFFPQPSRLLTFLGLPIEIIGIFIAVWGVLELSLATTSALKEDHLVKTGPYKHCRNPQHLGIFILMIGLSLFHNSLFLLILSIICVVWAIFRSGLRRSGCFDYLARNLKII